MSIDKFNAERYYDPTAYEAMTIIETEEKQVRRFKPIVYICSPYAGDVENNVTAARKYSRFAVDNGCLPLTPHLLFPQFLNDNDSKDRKLGLWFGIVLMSKCAQVWVFGEYISDGMQAEINQAKSKGYIIRYFNENLEEVHD